eukprot:gene5572-7696_t
MRFLLYGFFYIATLSLSIAELIEENNTPLISGVHAGHKIEYHDIAPHKLKMVDSETRNLRVEKSSAVNTKTSTFAPTGKPIATPRPTSVPSPFPGLRPTTPPSSDVSYHNGPLLIDNKAVYHLFYGSKYTSTSKAVTLTQYFAQNLGGSDYFNTMTSYKDSTGTKVKNQLKFGGNVIKSASQTTINDNFVMNTIYSAIKVGTLPQDENALYYFIFDGSLSYSGWLTSWCGFHSYFTYTDSKTGKTVYIKFAVIGDPSLAANGGSGCVWWQYGSTGTPNGNAGLDTMMSVYAHELAETTTDPVFNGYYTDSTGDENADKCAWNVGNLLTGQKNANVQLGSKYFLLQSMWVYNPPYSGCFTSY